MPSPMHVTGTSDRPELRRFHHTTKPSRPPRRALRWVAALVLWVAIPAAAVPQAGEALVVDGSGSPTTAPPARPPAAQRLILKLRAGLDACVGCVLRQGQRLGPLGVGSRLDGLFAAYHIRAARPLLRHVGSGQRRPDPRARFPLRAARAPRGARAPDFDRTWVLTARQRPDLDAVARALAADPAVEYCEPDRLVEPALVPNDTFFGTQGSWGQPFDDLWGAKRIGGPAAWDVTRGAGVVVAIVDTGIDHTHPDLAANLWTNPAEVAGNGVDDDSNGFVDDIRGWDFADDDAGPRDDHSHGTHVAGTVAAVGGNAAGIVGIAFESRVMAVRGLGTYGFGWSSDLAEAILYAVDNGADVINASWGGGGFSQTIADAVAAAHAAGAVFVAAAGNSDADTADFFPASSPDAITVSAFTHADERAAFSNFGVKLDVGAPGGGDDAPPKKSPAASILSLLASGLAYGNQPSAELILADGASSYVRFAGTSMAAPHVSGTAALVLAAQPGLSVEQVRQVLRTTADDVGPPGPDVDSGFGLVNAAAAVAAPAPLEAHIASPAGAELIGPTLVPVVGSAQGPGFASYTLDYRRAEEPEGWVALAGPVAAPVDGGQLAVWDMTELPEDGYVLRLRVDRPGETFTDQVALRVRTIAITAPEILAALRPDAPIEIRGTAAGPGFVGYAVEVRRPTIHGTEWQTTGITLAVPPGTPVRNGLLATLDASGLTEGDRFDFRVTVTDATGTKEVTRRGLVIDPTLRSGWPQPVVPMSSREYLTAADLDGDGAQEVLVGSGSEVVVFQADGSVRAGWPQPVAPGEPFAETHGSPLVADVTGDGRPEVIASNGSALLVWSPDGTLQSGFPAHSEVLAGGVNEFITLADLDGDGQDEIVSVGGGGAEAFRGDGTRVSTFGSSAGIYGAPAVADVLGDSRSELAWFSPLNHLSGRGIVSLIGPDGAELAARRVKGTFFTRAWFADMDGDGGLDMIVLGQRPNSTQRIRVTATTATGRNIRLVKPRVRGPWKRSSRMLAFSDLDRDGHAEAWGYFRTPTSDWWSSTDESGFFAPHQHEDNLPQQMLLQHRLFSATTYRDWPFAVAIGDVDGDGVQELVGGMVGNGCGAMGDRCLWSIRRAVPVQRPDGALVAEFPKPVPQFFPGDFGATPPVGAGVSFDDLGAATPTIADLDGDGLKEILWYDPEASRIFAWNVEGTPGPLLADWPMYAHDPKHSNTLPARMP